MNYIDDEISILNDNVLSCVGWILNDNMNIIWWGECGNVDEMMIINNNLVLRTIHMFENELTIFFGKILLLLSMVYLGGWVPCQDSVSLNQLGGLA